MRFLKVIFLSLAITLPLSSHAQLNGLSNLTNLVGISGVDNILGTVSSIPLLDPTMLTQNLSSGGALLGSILLDPSNALSPVLGLATGVLGAVSPTVNILLSSPADLPTFLLLDGGTLLSPGLGGLPEIPLINTPLLGLAN